MRNWKCLSAFISLMTHDFSNLLNLLSLRVQFNCQKKKKEANKQKGTEGHVSDGRLMYVMYSEKEKTGSFMHPTLIPPCSVNCMEMTLRLTAAAPNIPLWDFVSELDEFSPSWGRWETSLAGGLHVGGPRSKKVQCLVSSQRVSPFNLNHVGIDPPSC